MFYSTAADVTVYAAKNSAVYTPGVQGREREKTVSPIFSREGVR